MKTVRIEFKTDGEITQIYELDTGASGIWLLQVLTEIKNFLKITL